MNAITFAVDRKNDDYIKTSIGPSNRSEEARFGWVDFSIIAFFLLCTSSLVCLLLLT